MFLSVSLKISNQSIQQLQLLQYLKHMTKPVYLAFIAIYCYFSFTVVMSVES